MLASGNPAAKRLAIAALACVAFGLALSAPAAAQAQGWSGGYERDGRADQQRGGWDNTDRRRGDRGWDGDRRSGRAWEDDRRVGRAWEDDRRRPGWQGGPRPGWDGPGQGGQRRWHGRWWARGAGPCWRWSQWRQNWRWVCD